MQELLLIYPNEATLEIMRGFFLVAVNIHVVRILIASNAFLNLFSSWSLDVPCFLRQLPHLRFQSLKESNSYDSLITRGTGLRQASCITLPLS